MRATIDWGRIVAVALFLHAADVRNAGPFELTVTAASGSPANTSEATLQSTTSNARPTKDEAEAAAKVVAATLRNRGNTSFTTPFTAVTIDMANGQFAMEQESPGTIHWSVRLGDLSPNNIKVEDTNITKGRAVEVTAWCKGPNTDPFANKCATWYDKSNPSSRRAEPDFAQISFYIYASATTAPGRYVEGRRDVELERRFVDSLRALIQYFQRG